MSEYKLRCEFENGLRIWDGPFTTAPNQSPLAHARQLLFNFNNSLRPNESSRKLIRIMPVGNKTHTPHDWGKRSLVTESGGYDLWACKACGKKYKRKGLGWSPPTDSCKIKK